MQYQMMYTRIQEIRESYKDRLDAAKSNKPLKPHLAREHTSEDAREYVEKLTDYEKKLAEFKDEESYYKIVQEMNNQIEEEIKEESGLNSIVPEQYRDRVWSKAWSDGHSSGYSDVYSCLCSLVEIFNL